MIYMIKNSFMKRIDLRVLIVHETFFEIRYMKHGVFWRVFVA